jgi:hypothetical protein
MHGGENDHPVSPMLCLVFTLCLFASARDVDARRLAASGISEVVHHPLTSSELAGALSRCLPLSDARELQS